MAAPLLELHRWPVLQGGPLGTGTGPPGHELVLAGAEPGQPAGRRGATGRLEHPGLRQAVPPAALPQRRPSARRPLAAPTGRGPQRDLAGAAAHHPGLLGAHHRLLLLLPHPRPPDRGPARQVCAAGRHQLVRLRELGQHPTGSLEAQLALAHRPDQEHGLQLLPHPLLQRDAPQLLRGDRGVVGYEPGPGGPDPAAVSGQDSGLLRPGGHAHHPGPALVREGPLHPGAAVVPARTRLLHRGAVHRGLGDACQEVPQHGHRGGRPVERAQEEQHLGQRRPGHRLASGRRAGRQRHPGGEPGLAADGGGRGRGHLVGRRPVQGRRVPRALQDPAQAGVLDARVLRGRERAEVVHGPHLPRVAAAHLGPQLRLPAAPEDRPGLRGRVRHALRPPAGLHLAAAVGELHQRPVHLGRRQRPAAGRDRPELDLLGAEPGGRHGRHPDGRLDHAHRAEALLHPQGHGAAAAHLRPAHPGPGGQLHRQQHHRSARRQPVSDAAPLVGTETGPQRVGVAAGPAASTVHTAMHCIFDQNADTKSTSIYILR
mmetsp:Transcript_11097/g.16723  ORF Transcript_11097/g.16723 Transcript_11097/m.16723 type:complete len:542 (-) Transcript_11097:33-1658(-)